MIRQFATTYSTVLRAFALAVATSACVFLCACGAGARPTSSSAPSLTTLSVTPTLAEVALGRTIQLSVTGTYSDHTSKDLTRSAVWSASDPKIANVDASGLATSIAVGQAVLTATADGMSARATLTVANAALTSIVVTPPASSIALGQSVQLTATGTYSDKSTQDVTGSVTWSSSQAAVASVSSSGMASSKAVGSAIITATLRSFSGANQLIVSPAALIGVAVTSDRLAVPVGTTTQFTARGTFTDGSTQDLTSAVGWASSSLAIVTVSPSGLATGKAAGAATISATDGALRGTAALTVSSAALVSLSVSSSTASIPIGQTAQFVAKGKFTDGSTQDLTSTATWASSSPAIVTVSASGLTTGKAAGTATISATAGALRGTAAMTVSSATLVSLGVTSSAASIPLGLTAQLTAKGKFTDGSTQDLTNSVSWGSSPVGIVGVSTSGLATSHAVGAATVTASSGSTRASAPLTVSAAALMSIDVASTKSSFPLGTSQQVIATGRLTDGTLHDITNTVLWSSSSAKIISITNKGLATGVAQGTATISASTPGASSPTLIGKVVLGVSAPQLTAISIAPDRPVIPLGSKQALVATGTFTDGSTKDLTQTGAWSAADPQIADVSQSGIAIAQKVGTTAVTSSFQGVLGSTILTVQSSAAVSYFTKPATGGDTTVRITNPAVTGLNLCALIYVFDNDQQLTECCGCQVSQDGLRTLSLTKDLLSNPLTGVQSVTGSIFVIPAEYASNTSCNPSSITPSGMVVAWATHIQNGSAGLNAVTEDSFSATPLPSAESAALQAQCYFVQQLGSGQGICTCGTGK